MKKLMTKLGEFINSKKAKAFLLGTASMLASAFGLDIADEQVSDVVTTLIAAIAGLTAAYIGGQSYVDKTKEAAKPQADPNDAAGAEL